MMIACLQWLFFLYVRLVYCVHRILEPICDAFTRMQMLLDRVEWKLCVCNKITANAAQHTVNNWLAVYTIFPIDVNAKRLCILWLTFFYQRFFFRCGFGFATISFHLNGFVVPPILGKFTFAQSVTFTFSYDALFVQCVFTSSSYKCTLFYYIIVYYPMSCDFRVHSSTEWTDAIFFIFFQHLHIRRTRILWNYNHITCNKKFRWQAEKKGIL